MQSFVLKSEANCGGTMLWNQTFFRLQLRCLSWLLSFHHFAVQCLKTLTTNDWSAKRSISFGKFTLSTKQADLLKTWSKKWRKLIQIKDFQSPRSSNTISFKETTESLLKFKKRFWLRMKIYKSYLVMSQNPLVMKSCLHTACKMTKKMKLKTKNRD